MSDEISESLIDSIIKESISTFKDMNNEINEMNDEQKRRFYHLVNDIYMELFDEIENNLIPKIRLRRPDKIELSIYNNLQQEPDVADYTFDFTQFKKIVVTTILVNIYKLDNIDFGGIFKKNDDYQFIIAQLFIYITDIPEMAKRITELASDIGANGFKTRKKKDEETSLEPPPPLRRDQLVIPPPPTYGWPSENHDKSGGKTNRKRKNRSRTKSKSKSTTKSKSKKRRYKSRQRRR